MPTLRIKDEYEGFVTKTFRIPDEFNQKLTEIAKKHNTSVNKVVNQMLQFALDNLEDD